MRRLLSPVLICCAIAAGCGNDSGEPADSDTPEECLDEPCGSGSEDGNDSSTIDDSSDDSDSVETDPADDADLEAEDDVDTEAFVQTLTEAWGADEDLVRCVVEELSLDDLAAIDPAAIDDPTKEVCGTTLLALMTGAG